jgi:alkanesulfonate monooxygenase SsuD/methylene tetrahydromethanopterin reductase-like flavin-dependent oxidoreductase (luciferase family)
MRFGTFHLQCIPPWSNPYDVVHQQFEQMLAAEENGFHEVWLAEHNGRRYAMLGNTVALATALAAKTERIRIATAVVRLPLHNPLHVAEDLAYADVLSGGRIDFGVGKGYDKLEFATYGVDIEERETLWAESFDAVRQIWRTGQIEFHGKHFNLSEGELLPPPIQRPELPIFVMVSGSERSIAFAAERLLPIAFSSGPSSDELRGKVELYCDFASSAGHSDDEILRVVENFWQLKPMYVASTRKLAIEHYRPGMEWYMDALANRAMFGFSHEKLTIEEFAERQNVLLGSPSELVEQLAEYCERSGVSNFISWINMGGAPSAQVLPALRLFGDEVIPKLADVLPSRRGAATAAA